MLLKGKTYDRAKTAVQVWIPATSAAYFGLAQIWGLPGAEKVVGSLAILATFLGVTLGVSSRNYEKSEAAYDGDVVVKTHETGQVDIVRFAAELTPEELGNKKSVRFKVKEDTAA